MTTDSTHEARIVPGEACPTCKGKGGVTEEAGAGVYVGAKCPDCFGFGTQEIVDLIAEALSDSLGPDWSPSLGARWVAGRLSDAGFAPNTPSAPPADLEADSRELLADEAARAGYDARRDLILQGCANAEVYVPVALRAIQRALSARQIAQDTRPEPPLHGYAEGDWQPIETAPRDGSNFLAIGGVYHGLPYPCRWEPGDYNGHQPWKLPLSAGRLYEHVPRHWQPLPAPPKEPQP